MPNGNAFWGLVAGSSQNSFPTVLPPFASVIAYYKLGDLVDSKGGSSLSLSGSVNQSSGVSSSSIFGRDYAGWDSGTSKTGYFIVPSGSRFTADPFSISAWVLSLDTGNNVNLWVYTQMSTLTNSSSSTGITTYIVHTTGSPNYRNGQIYHNNPGFSFPWGGNSAQWADGTVGWRHLVWSVSNGSCTTYLDGALSTIAQINSTPTAINDFQSAAIAIGAGQQYPGGASNATNQAGFVSNVGLYNIALNAGHAAALFNGGLGAYPTGIS